MTPSPTRLARYRRVERRRGLPLAIKAILAVAVVALSAGVLSVATGAVGPVTSGIAQGFGGFVDTVSSVVSSPVPTPPPDVADAPSIVSPDEAYTNEDTVDVTVNVPANVAGVEGYHVRLWITLPDEEPQVVQELPVGPTARLVIPGVELTKGRNELQATIIGPGGESDQSDAVTWVLDQSRPSIKITTPSKASSSTTREAITVKGKTQARSTVRVQNDLNGASITVEAGTDGLFQARIAIASGINTLTITSTDPAGNPNTETISVRRGSGSMQISLTGTAYRFTAKRLPRTVTFTVVVAGPDGRRLSGASALFTVTVPGLEAIVSSGKLTNRSGIASFTTSIPKGALPGSGLASVFVRTEAYGEGTDRQVLTVK